MTDEDVRGPRDCRFTRFDEAVSLGDMRSWSYGAIEGIKMQLKNLEELLTKLTT